MHIVLVDSSEDHFVAELEGLGHSCNSLSVTEREALVDNVADAEVIIVRSTVISADAIAAAPHLGLIVRAGAGTDTIDVDAASAAGIYVCNVPGQNAVAVAELTMGLMIAIDRRIPAANADFANGVWDKTGYSNARGLKGQALAILGLGNIGFEVASRAKGFGLSLHALQASDRSATATQRIDELDIQIHGTQRELLGAADIVTIHLPLNPDTQNLVNTDFLSLMQPGAMLINTSRGGLVNEQDLLKAMNERGIRAGLDVYTSEPKSGTAQWTSPFSGHPNFVGTHHIGASTAQAQNAIENGVLQTIKEYELGLPPNCVNIASRPLGECALAVRHRDEVGVLAGVLACLRSAGINVQQMRNEIFDGSGTSAAMATIRVSQTPTASTLETLENLDHVLRIDVLGAE